MSSKAKPGKATSVRRKKRRFRGNKYVKPDNEGGRQGTSQSEELEDDQSDETPESDSDQEGASVSARKLNADTYFSDNEEEDDKLGENQVGFRLIDIELLNNVLLTFCICSSCKSGHIELFDLLKRKQGYASCLVLRCAKCKTEKEFYSSKRPSGKGRFEINTRMVVAMRRIGRGREAMNKLSEVLNMPKGMEQSSYDLCVQEVVEKVEKLAEKSMQVACEEVKECSEPDQNGKYQIAVSCDGTWLTRGYSSRYGVYCTMSLVTGKVLDCHIMSKYYKVCAMKGDKMDKNSREHREWKQQHESECEQNYEGSSPAMEQEGAKVVFARSEEKDLQYVEFLGDGDSKAYEEAKKFVTYNISKVDCVNHVSKRIGSSLRELKKKAPPLSDGKGWGGAGRVTENTMKNMQKYYYRAIKNNLGNVEATQRAVWAILYHRASTDAKPQHSYCSETWCGYLKDRRNYKTDRDKVLNAAIVEAVKPIFQRLSDPALLARCKKGKTQNQNESLHGVIWGLCPEEGNVGLSIVKLAVYFAIYLFNDGEISVTRLLETLEVLPGIFQELGIRWVDSTRLYHAERKTTEGFKKRRTALKTGKRGLKRKKSKKRAQHMEQDNSRCNNRCKEPLFWPFYLYTVFIVCFLKTRILVL